MMRTAGVWTGVIAPTAALNIWPHIEAIMTCGTCDSRTIVPHATMVVIKTAFVVGLAYLPIKAEEAGTLKLATVCWLLWALLATVCFFNAQEGAGRLRDLLLSGSRESVSTAAALDSRIAELEKSRDGVPPHGPASAAMVENARSAVTDAQTARDQECGKVGDNCRKRVGEVEAANLKLAGIEERFALTQMLADINAKLAQKREERAAMTPPKFKDAAAARIALILSKIGIKTTEAQVTDWWPNWLAAVIEAWAALGAYCFLPRRKKSEEKPQTVEAEVEIKEAEVPQDAVAPVPETVEKPAAVQTPAKKRSTAASAAKSGKPKHKRALVHGPVRDWFDEEVKIAQGSEVRPGVAYDTYSDWCRRRNLKPVSLTTFGTTMKKDLGVGYEERSKRGYYLGILLTGKPKLAVVGS